MNFYKETKIVCYTIPFFNAFAGHSKYHLNLLCFNTGLMCHISDHGHKTVTLMYLATHVFSN